MAKIYAPNKEYTGMSAGVSFCNGVGETDTPRIIEWFKIHGYRVEEPMEIPEPELPIVEDEDIDPEQAPVSKKKPTGKKAGE